MKRPGLPRIRSGNATPEEAGLEIIEHLQLGRPGHLFLYGALREQTIRIIRGQVAYGESWGWRQIMRAVRDQFQRRGSDYAGHMDALHDLVDWSIREREQLDRSGRLDPLGRPEVPPAAAGHEARSGE
ncbi:hypothetical protein CcrColossus_gp390 [Caulobacter phage CcrColossus]|uniref:Uncharacterized protein n=1 Tax=Caulobacter phage CcrColossus TaxID=1211640 RepID=K4JV68_9CAUD|nr:hypothetical protein CcrColossus_gp390 [Caulobacter phage CcrColossus]AFU88260.1 hypothetical protein CcrColossus_gp390 [Caulobacter phage CcrColossus]